MKLWTFQIKIIPKILHCLYTFALIY